jgi:hypothetical protein
MKTIIKLSTTAVVALGLAIPGIAYAGGDGNSGCPQGGGWFTQSATSPDDPWDTNGDGTICTRNMPEKAQGDGNSANRAGAADEGHVPGHNHKDNNNPTSD